MDIAYNHELPVLEDACEILDSEYAGRRCETVDGVAKVIFAQSLRLPKWAMVLQCRSRAHR